ncbi:MAG: 50S ribosomal protein L31e, partial [Candidatus Pacearchaeota archaeon]|nr:50S ribosomal protein L31e [Candidatus Pacearchaeota archaeon]
IEREYIIPLREKSRSVPRYKKTPKAVKTIKEFLARHMKVENRDLNKIKISKDLNQFLWAKGIRKHPHKIKVKAIKKGENVIVELVDYPNNLKFKKLREEKIGKEALETLDKKKTVMQKMKENMQKPAEEKIEDKDKDKDGLDDKEEAIEKEKASAESTQQFEKAQAKQAKHQTEKPAKAVKPFRQALQK